MLEIKNTLNSIANFDGEWIDECVVQNYIDKVVTRTATDFEWCINLQGNAEQFMFEHDDKRSNETYEDKSRKTLELQSRSYTLAFTFTLTFEQARAFKKQFGKYLRTNQWNDMTVKVYLR